jgi:cell division protein FtsX
MYAVATAAFWTLALATRGEAAGSETTVNLFGALLNAGLLGLAFMGSVRVLGWLGVEASFLACLFLLEAVSAGKLIAVILVVLSLIQLFLLWRVWIDRQESRRSTPARVGGGVQS